MNNEQVLSIFIKDIGVHNTLQAFQLRNLVSRLPGEVDHWDIEVCQSEYEDKYILQLVKGGRTVHTTSSPNDMHTYLSALVALEGN